MDPPVAESASILGPIRTNESNALGRETKHQGRGQYGLDTEEKGDLLPGADDLGRLPRRSQLAHTIGHLQRHPQASAI